MAMNGGTNSHGTAINGNDRYTIPTANISTAEEPLSTTEETPAALLAMDTTVFYQFPGSMLVAAAWAALVRESREAEANEVERIGRSVYGTEPF